MFNKTELRVSQLDDHKRMYTRRDILKYGASVLAGTIMTACGAPTTKVVPTTAPEGGRYIPKNGYIVEPLREGSQIDKVRALTDELYQRLGIKPGSSFKTTPLTNLRSEIAKVANIAAITPVFQIILPDRMMHAYSTRGGEINPVSAEGIPSQPDNSPVRVDTTSGKELMNFAKDGKNYYLVGYTMPPGRSIDQAAWQNVCLQAFVHSESAINILHIPTTGHPPELFSPRGVVPYDSSPTPANVFARSGSSINPDGSIRRADIILNPAVMKLRGSRLGLSMPAQVAQSLADEMVTLAAVQWFQNRLFKGEKVPELDMQHELASSMAGWATLMREMQGIENPFVTRDVIATVSDFVK